VFEIFSLLNKNKDNHLTWEEMYSVDIDELVTAFPHCFIRPGGSHAYSDPSTFLATFFLGTSL